MKVFLCLVVIVCFVSTSANGQIQACVFSKLSKVETIVDASFLNREKTCVFRPKNVDSLKGFVKMVAFYNKSKPKGKRIVLSIAGTKHSQGGHIFAQGGVMIDMSALNMVGKPIKKDGNWSVTAQAGATWEDLHDKILPLGLVNRVQQSSAPFSIGGSVAVNCHGRSHWDGPIYKTVESIRIIDSDGNLKHLSRKQNNDHFDLVVGGYGLFGIIVDVTLSLELNHKLRAEVYYHQNIDSYIKLLEKKGRDNKNIAYQFSILDLSLYYAGNLVPEKFLTKNTSYWYYSKKAVEKPGERNADPKEGFINSLGVVALKMAKSSGMVRNMLQWGQEKFLQKQTSRSMMLTPPIQAVLNSQNPNKPDILQEYFIPVEQFSSFFAKFRKLMIDAIGRDKDLAISNVSLRYIPALIEDSRLRYSRNKEDMIAMVLYTQVGKGSLHKAKERTIQLVDLALFYQGTYYLPYQLWPSIDQLKKSYPEIDSVMQDKKEYDPNGLFSNRFYERYFHSRSKAKKNGKEADENI